MHVDEIDAFMIKKQLSDKYVTSRLHCNPPIVGLESPP